MLEKHWGAFLICVDWLAIFSAIPLTSMCPFPYVPPLTIYWQKQVFFRAGVLGQMEELRDERLGKIVTWMQSWVRGYLSRKEFKKLQEQRLALQVCQRNLRKYLKLRTWPWYKLWQKVKPLLNVTRVEDEIAVSEKKFIWSNPTRISGNLFACCASVYI